MAVSPSEEQLRPESANSGAKDVANGVAPAKEGEPEKSNWGLFRRWASTVKEIDVDGQPAAFKSLTYQCAGQLVEFRQPLQGAGTTLMHGDFARKLSPSEEAMALWIIKHPKAFQDRKVMVVGAGLGFAGLVCAACTNAKRLELTDGDPEVVRTLVASTKLNQNAFGSTKVEVRKVLWDRMEDWPEKGSFDIVLGADVVYLEALHSALQGLVARVLRPGGLFLLLASRRNGSLEKFISSAKGNFPIVEASTDYDGEVAQAIGRATKCFPVMVRIVQPQEVEESALHPSIAKMQEAMRAQQEQRLREAEIEARKKAKAEKKRRQASLELVERRERRIEAAALSALEQPQAPVQEVEQAPRVPIISHAEQQGKSDWGLFSRRCTASPTFKDMIFECGGHEVSIRKPLSRDFQYGDLAHKLSAAEEALTFWVLKYKRSFKKKRVLELGAGVGLAGLAVAACTAAKHVQLTDGDPAAVSMLEANLDLNRGSLRCRKVSVSQVRFGEGLDGVKPFDWVIAADIIAAEANHAAILKTIRRALKPTGTAIILAPASSGSVGSSIDAFVTSASTIFDHIEVTRDYDEEVSKAFHGMRCFPKMIRLQRSTGHPLATRPESRNRALQAALKECREGNTPVAQARSKSLPPAPQTKEPAAEGPLSERKGREAAPIRPVRKAPATLESLLREPTPPTPSVPEGMEVNEAECPGESSESQRSSSCLRSGSLGPRPSAYPSASPVYLGPPPLTKALPPRPLGARSGRPPPAPVRATVRGCSPSPNGQGTSQGFQLMPSAVGLVLQPLHRRANSLPTFSSAEAS